MSPHLRLTSLFTFLLGILLMGADATPATDPPAILCLGDSLTAGFGVATGESYPSLLQKRLREEGFPHRVINAGVSGDTTTGGLYRLEWALRSRPVIAIVVLGANDGLRGLDLEAMKQNLVQILTRLRAANVDPLLGGMRLPPNYGAGYETRFQAIYPEVATETGATLIPFFLEGVAGDPALNQPDGIHPTAAGYRVILENVWGHLAPRLGLGLDRKAAAAALDPVPPEAAAR
ncbi:MAG: arylesterase [Magnetococcales bacterium]|nr:arylesterase [Magnetococcales bacterium]